MMRDRFLARNIQGFDRMIFFRGLHPGAAPDALRKKCGERAQRVGRWRSRAVAGPTTGRRAALRELSTETRRCARTKTGPRPGDAAVSRAGVRSDVPRPRAPAQG